MRLGRYFTLVICGIITVTACGALECAQTVTGTLLSVAGDSGSFVLKADDSAPKVVLVAKDAKVMRGQVGKDLRAVQLRDLAQGDRVVAVVSQDGSATSVKGFFGVVIGTAAGVSGDKLALQDGRSVTLRPEAQVVLGDGSVGKPSDIKPGMLVKCRVNPASTEAWTVFAALPDKKKTPAPPKAAPVAKPVAKQAAKADTKPVSALPEKSKILSVTYSAPSPLKVGDLLTVDVSGTPGGNATFEVKDLIKAAHMDEVSPGAYRAVLEIPKGKSVRSAALVARIAANGAISAPVQASRLVTVEPAIVAPNRPSATVQLVSMKPEPVAAVETKTETKPTPVKVILTNPPDGAKITRALLIRGIADPDAKVMVTVTYTNGLTGLLKLAGEVASQMVAVGKNGEFRMGPIALEGPLATQGLEFTIKAYYTDREDHG
ncbi:MAG: hypothetical protein ACYC64_15275, partial [Armatimonadota bacterium]